MESKSYTFMCFMREDSEPGGGDLKEISDKVSVPLTAVTNTECCPRKAEMNSKALRYHSHLLEAASPSVKLSQ